MSNPEPASSWRRARVARIVQETADCRSFELAVDGAWAAEPGQHCTLALDIDGRRQLRCYSLSGLPKLGEPPRLTVKRRPGGFVSHWLNEVPQPGLEVEVSEPAGGFVVRPGAAEVLFLSAGSGVTPLLPMLRQLLAAGGRSVSMLYVNRTPAEVIFASALADLARRFAGRFSLATRFTRPEALDLEQAVAEAMADLGEAPDVYLCGPEAFMRRCEREVLARGVRPDRIFTESFGAPAAETCAAADTLAVVRRAADAPDLLLRTPAGGDLLQALRLSGASNVGVCGGRASCGTCRVRLEPRWADALPPPSRGELRLLRVLPDPRPDHRLACQIRLAPELAGLAFTPDPL